MRFPILAVLLAASVFAATAQCVTVCEAALNTGHPAETHPSGCPSRSHKDHPDPGRSHSDHDCSTGQTLVSEADPHHAPVTFDLSTLALLPAAAPGAFSAVDVLAARTAVTVDGSLRLLVCSITILRV